MEDAGPHLGPGERGGPKSPSRAGGRGGCRTHEPLRPSQQVPAIRGLSDLVSGPRLILQWDYPRILLYWNWLIDFFWNKISAGGRAVPDLAPAQGCGPWGREPRLRGRGHRVLAVGSSPRALSLSPGVLLASAAGAYSWWMLGLGSLGAAMSPAQQPLALLPPLPFSAASPGRTAPLTPRRSQAPTRRCSVSLRARQVLATPRPSLRQRQEVRALRRPLGPELQRSRPVPGREDCPLPRMPAGRSPCPQAPFPPLASVHRAPHPRVTARGLQGA